jgi:hypothetical protein
MKKLTVNQAYSKIISTIWKLKTLNYKVQIMKL